MKLDPSTVEPHQYNGIPLTVKGESKITLQKGQKIMPGSFVLFGNAHNQLVRDQLYKIQLNWPQMLRMANLGSGHQVENQSIKEQFAEEKNFVCYS